MKSHGSSCTKTPSGFITSAYTWRYGTDAVGSQRTARESRRQPIGEPTSSQLAEAPAAKSGESSAKEQALTIQISQLIHCVCAYGERYSDG